MVNQNDIHSVKQKKGYAQTPAGCTYDQTNGRMTKESMPAYSQQCPNEVIVPIARDCFNKFGSFIRKTAEFNLINMSLRFDESALLNQVPVSKSISAVSQGQHGLWEIILQKPPNHVKETVPVFASV